MQKVNRRLRHFRSVATPHSPTAILGLLMVLGFVMRLALIIATPHLHPQNDAADYDRIARSIAHGHGYPNTNYAAPGTPAAWRPPAYPALLSLVYLAFGDSITAGRVLSAVLGVVTIALVFVLARTVWGARVGWTAAAIAVIFPPLIMLNASLISEALFVPLVLAAVLSVLAYRRRGSIAWVVPAGVLCGLAALTRAVGVVLVLAVVVGILTASARPRRARGYAATAAVLACALTIAPWTIRNAIAYRQFVPISTEDGLTAAGTYNRFAGAPGPAHGVWFPPFWVREWRGLFRVRLNEAQVDQRLRSYAFDYLWAHPSYALYVTAANLLRLFDLGPGHTITSRAWYAEMGVPARARSPTTWSLWLLVVVALAGLVVLRVADLRVVLGPGFLWLTPVLLALAVVPFVGGVRHRAPIDPFVVLLAALVAVRLVEHRDRVAAVLRGRRPLAVGRSR